jgi:asparagine N-glycosylation enzyme membrane subunit Stt3
MRVREVLKDIIGFIATLLLPVAVFHPIILYHVSEKFRSEVTEGEAYLFTVIIMLLVLILLYCCNGCRK